MPPWLNLTPGTVFTVFVWTIVYGCVRIAPSALTGWLIFVSFGLLGWYSARSIMHCRDNKHDRYCHCEDPDCKSKGPQ